MDTKNSRLKLALSENFLYCIYMYQILQNYCFDKFQEEI